MIKRFEVKLLILLVLLNVRGGFCLAEDGSKVYRSLDSSGKTIYSSTPLPDSEEAISLPQIEKENIDDKIKELKNSIPPNCENHGGLNCSGGPDFDGSVICLDGFRDAHLPFRFACLEANIQVFSFSLFDSNKNPLPLEMSKPFWPQAETAHFLQVSIRNNSDVEALGVNVFIKKTWRNKLIGVGPDLIKPYEIVDYSFFIEDLRGLENIKKLNKGLIKILCKNCR